MNESEQDEGDNNGETGNFLDDEPKSLTLLKGTVLVSHFDHETKQFKEFKTVGILMDTYIALVPSGGFTDEINLHTTQVKYIPSLKNHSKVSSDYLSKGLQPLNYKSKEPKSVSSINWSLIALLNPIGDYLFDSHFLEGKYCHFSPFSHFIDQGDTKPLALITIASNLVEEEAVAEVNHNDSSVLSLHSDIAKEPKEVISVEEEFKVIPLSTVFYHDEVSDKYYFFLLHQKNSLNLNHGGIIVDTSQRVYGIYKANCFMSIEKFAQKFHKDLNSLRNSTTLVYQAICIEVFTDEDLEDFYLTKKLIIKENNALIGNLTYSQSVFDKIANQINKCPNKQLAAQSLILAGDSLIKRMENIQQANLKKYDQDIIVRKLLLYSLDPIETVQLDSKTFTGNYFTTVMNYLFFNTTLIELNLSHSQLEDGVMTQLGYILSKANNLQTLILSDTNLTLNGLFVVVSALKQNKFSKVERLDLSYNTFKTVKAVTSLKLNLFFKPVQAGVRQDNLLFLTDLFFLPKIKSLRLDHIVNFKESEELSKIFEAVHQSLQSKMISKLQMIDLSGSDLSTPQAMETLIQCLLKLNSLKNLILKECGITDRSMATLSSQIVKQKAIYSQLDLSSNKLTEESAGSFNELFKVYSAVMTKFINDNPNAMALPQYQICLNNNIELNRHKPQSSNRKGFMFEEMQFPLPTVLELANTNMNVDSLTALANAFKLDSNLNITKLNLASNEITDEMLKASDLPSAIKANQFITTLFLHSNPIRSKSTVISLINPNKKAFLIVIDYVLGFDCRTLDFLKNLKFYSKKGKNKGEAI